jgi:hypothetical protein
MPSRAAIWDAAGTQKRPLRTQRRGRLSHLFLFAFRGLYPSILNVHCVQRTS